MLDAYRRDNTRNLSEMPVAQPLPLQLEVGRGIHDPESREKRQDFATFIETDCSTLLPRQGPRENHCKVACHDSYATWTPQPTAWGRTA